MRPDGDLTRPTLIVAEPEPEQALSIQKLVLETAKFNVLAAHSGRECQPLRMDYPFRAFSGPFSFLSGSEGSSHFYQAIVFPTKFIPPESS
jgi:hypothetical protein